jgi:hypothetical protein
VRDYILPLYYIISFSLLPAGGKILEQRLYVEESADCNDNRKTGKKRQAQKEEERPNFNPIHLNRS